MKKKCNNSNLKDASRIIRDGGGVTSDRHQTGWVRFAHTAPYRKCGFTLAEVLITLAIVGVVAAITMPALIANIQERVKTARIQNIKQKFSKATDKMLSVTTLNGYASTMEFVNELQNHLKIAKICTNDKLNECWPTEEVILDDEGNTWAIKETKKAKNLKMPESDSVDYDDTVGIVTADGTAMILTYDKKCDIDENKTITWNNDQSSTTGCIGAIFDWNGSKMPNKLSNDVITFNAGGLGSACAFEINGGCFKSPQKATNYLSQSECEAISSGLGILYCEVEKDYFAAAVQSCGHVNKMASMYDIADILSELHGGADISVDVETQDLTYNSEKAVGYGFPSNGSFEFISNEEVDGVNIAFFDVNFDWVNPWYYFDDYGTRGEKRNRYYVCKE